MSKTGFMVGIAGLLAALWLTGCVTIGRAVPGGLAAQIVMGETTRAEIVERFGQPFRTGLDSGLRTVTYLHYRVGLFTEPVTTDLTVVYTPEGKVKSYVFSTNQPE